MATQYSGSPLPLPIRVSSGFPETGLCGEIFMKRRPSRGRKCAEETRPASVRVAARELRPRDAARFDLLRGDPRGGQRLQAIFAVGHTVAARGNAFHLPALA